MLKPASPCYPCWFGVAAWGLHELLGIGVELDFVELLVRALMAYVYRLIRFSQPWAQLHQADHHYRQVIILLFVLHCLVSS